MDVTIRTLTPLWTGNVDGTMDRIHEAGIIGSLRWWYEAIVRGLGGWACDPSKHECPDKAGKHCDVCRVFGATGWRRRFRLEVVDDTQTIWDDRDRMLNIRPPDRNRGWFLPPGQMGTLTLRLDGDERTLALLAALFLFLERWGSIGAKPQLGYGVFAVENRDQVQQWASRWQWNAMGDRKPDQALPDLRRFGFFRYRFRPEKPGWWTQVPGIRRVATQVQPLVTRYRTVPISPALKNEWRFHEWQRRWGDDRQIFGSLRPERRRSRVAVSWAYSVEKREWEVRGWGWLPAEQDAGQHLWRVLINERVWAETLGTTGGMSTLQAASVSDVQRVLEVVKE